MHQHTTIATAYDVIIVGGGAAGLSAALTLGRARRRVLVIDSAAPRNRFAGHMHGVLGHDGLPPLDLLEAGHRELERYDVTVTTGTVAQVGDIVRGLKVTCADGTVEYTRALLLAGGVDDELPDVPGLAEHWGDTVFQCPYCHGWEVRDRRIGVLATSGSIAHYGMLLRQWTDRLTVLPVGEAGTAALRDMDGDTRARFAARGIRLTGSPVTEVLSSGGTLTGVRTADGSVHELDALAVVPVPRPRDSCVAGLGLDRTQVPGSGSFLTVDPAGRTGHPRIWAAGNVVQPWLNVPMSGGLATMTASALNLALIEEDTDAAVRATEPHRGRPEIADDGYWESSYAGARPRWSGRPNSALVDYLTRYLGEDATGGAAHAAGAAGAAHAADIGCGEGADAVWLAAHGWTTTGVEVSGTALGRARALAEKAGAGDRVEFTADGLVGYSDAVNSGTSPRPDLVTVSYLHSPSQADRASLLHTAGDLLAPGGHLFVLSHILPGDDSGAPADAGGHGSTGPDRAAAVSTVPGLDPEDWTVVAGGAPERDEILPDGSVARSRDRALLLRRR